jgi:predicted nucleic acid-binding protein
VYFEEEGSTLVEDWLRAADLVATSWVAYVEARAAFARRLRPADARRARMSLDEDWERYLRIEASEALLRAAASVADRYRLRAYDAVHLASARMLRDQGGGPISFASWDHELDAAAARDGFLLFRQR